MDRSTSVEQLVAEYLSILGRMDDLEVDASGRTKEWNQLVNASQVLQLALRATADGRAGITALVGDESETVGLWSATFALAWEPAEARLRLQSISDAGGIQGFTAERTLREFDAGRLDTTWDPRDRRG